MKKTNKKGFVLTLDAVMALTVLLIVIFSTTTKIRTEENPLVYLSAQKTCSDMLTVLEKEGTLETLNRNTIEFSMNEVLYDNYEMLVTIDCNDTSYMGIGSNMPEEKTILKSKRFFVSDDEEGIDKLCTAECYVWTK